jgi:ribonuclease P protein component
MALAKKNRLNLRLHRLRVEANCKKLHSPLFTYLIAPQIEGTQPTSPRLAILVSKKLARKAVDRNKIKRKISQSIQNILPNLPHNNDIILIPKQAILDKTITQIQTDLKNVLSI